MAAHVRRLQALRGRGLPQRVPDRRDLPHRARHGEHQPGRLQRLPLLRVGVPWHWGFNGVPELPGSRGDITNDLSATVGDPNVYIQETKAFLCNVKKGVV